jgi:hypothetical protein
MLGQNKATEGRHMTEPRLLYPDNLVVTQDGICIR